MPQSRIREGEWTTRPGRILPYPWSGPWSILEGGRALSPFITNSPPYHKLRGKFSGFGVQPLSPFPCPVSKTLAAVLGS